MDTHSKDKFADNNVTETVHPIDKRVGNNVKSRREHLGIGTVQLAQVIGITPQRLRKYEHGANSISARQIVYLARMLDVPLAALFAGTEFMGRRRR